MSGRKGERLSRLLSGRASALGFANADEAGASSILDRVRRGSCLGCAVAVPVGEQFPPASCGCEILEKRALRAFDLEGYQRSRVLSGWCEAHARAVPKGQRRPKACAECAAGLPDWGALLNEASEAGFFDRHKIGAPVPLVARQADVRAALHRKGEAEAVASRGFAVLEGAAAKPRRVVPVSVVEIERQIAALDAERDESQRLLTFQRHRMTYQQFEAERLRGLELSRSLEALERQVKNLRRRAAKAHLIRQR